jgi:hypothetical protein
LQSEPSQALNETVTPFVRREKPQVFPSPAACLIRNALGTPVLQDKLRLNAPSQGFGSPRPHAIFQLFLLIFCSAAQNPLYGKIGSPRLWRDRRKTTPDRKARSVTDVELQRTVTIMQQPFQAMKAQMGQASCQKAGVVEACLRITPRSPVADCLGNDWRFFTTYADA